MLHRAPPLRGVRLGGTRLELADSASYGNCRRINRKHIKKKGIGILSFSNTFFVVCYAGLSGGAARFVAQVM